MTAWTAAPTTGSPAASPLVAAERKASEAKLKASILQHSEGGGHKQDNVGHTKTEAMEGYDKAGIDLDHANRQDSLTVTQALSMEEAVSTKARTRQVMQACAICLLLLGAQRLLPVTLPEQVECACTPMSAQLMARGRNRV